MGDPRCPPVDQTRATVRVRRNRLRVRPMVMAGKLRPMSTEFDPSGSPTLADCRCVARVSAEFGPSRPGVDRSWPDVLWSIGAMLASLGPRRAAELGLMMHATTRTQHAPMGCAVGQLTARAAQPTALNTSPEPAANRRRIRQDRIRAWTALGDGGDTDDVANTKSDKIPPPAPHNLGPGGGMRLTRNNNKNTNSQRRNEDQGTTPRGQLVAICSSPSWGRPVKSPSPT